MKIILFFTYKVQIKDWLKSGLFDREVELYTQLQKKGHEITFVTYDEESYDSLLREKNIKHMPIFKNTRVPKSNLAYILKTFLFLFKFKKEFKKADIYKSNQLLGAWLPIIGKLFFRKKLYIRTGYDLLEFSLKNKKNILKLAAYYFLTQIAIISSNIYTVTSKTDKKLIKKRFIYQINKLKIRNNWVYIPEKKQIEDRYKNKLLMVGRLEKQKNFELVIEKLKGSNFNLYIFGNGNDKDKLENLAHKNNVNLNIVDSIPNNDLIKEYGKYVIFLMPSIFEGNPKALLEAMAAGCIVIASNIKNHQELIDHGENGFLVDFNNLDLVNFIEDLFLDENKLEELSSNAMSYILENNSFEKYINKEILDYMSILQS